MYSPDYFITPYSLVSTEELYTINENDDRNSFLIKTEIFKRNIANCYITKKLLGINLVRLNNKMRNKVYNICKQYIIDILDYVEYYPSNIGPKYYKIVVDVEVLIVSVIYYFEVHTKNSFVTKITNMSKTDPYKLLLMARSVYLNRHTSSINGSFDGIKNYYDYINSKKWIKYWVSDNPMDTYNLFWESWSESGRINRYQFYSTFSTSIITNLLNIFKI